MSDISKIEALYKMVELSEKGNTSSAQKIQKIFVSSVRKDHKNRIYNENIELDRQTKKVLKSVLE